MHRFLMAASLALVGMLLPSSGDAQSRGHAAFAEAFGPCSGDVCVIRYNPGGQIDLFVAAAEAVRTQARRQVVIDGPCLSACAIFADIARANVCVTQRAAFGFHKARLYAVQRAIGGARQYREVRREDPWHSPDIAGWVRRNGGFPDEGYLMMSSRQASQFWRTCETRPVQAATGRSWR